MKGNVCITGVSRGIGLALARKFVSEGYAVFGSIRNKQNSALEELEQTGDFYPLIADVREKDMLEELRKSIEKKSSRLDILINNAGIISPLDRNAAELSPEAMEETFAVNVIGPLNTSLALYPLLVAGEDPLIVNVSSSIGSIGGIPDYSLQKEPPRSDAERSAYRTSKAALNMMTRILGRHWHGRGIRVMCIHPGWVQTDMGGMEASYTSEESAAGIFQQVTSWNREKPEFIDFQGRAILW